MEKNRNRSDLIAAGRKKLDQFRHKGKKKGTSHGKSADKTSKEGLDVETAASIPHIDAEIVAVDSSVSPATPKLVEEETVPINADQEAEEGGKDQSSSLGGFNGGEHKDIDPIVMRSGVAEPELPSDPSDDPSTSSPSTISVQFVEHHYAGIPISDDTGPATSVEPDIEQINGGISEGFVLLDSGETSDHSKGSSFGSCDLNSSMLIDQEADGPGLDRCGEMATNANRGEVPAAEDLPSGVDLQTGSGDSLGVAEEERSESLQVKDKEEASIGCSSGIDGESLGGGGSISGNESILEEKPVFERGIIDGSHMLATAPDITEGNGGITLLSPGHSGAQGMNDFSVSGGNDPILDPSAPNSDAEAGHRADGTSAIEHTGESVMVQENGAVNSYEENLEMLASGQEVDEEMHVEGVIVVDLNSKESLVKQGNSSSFGEQAVPFGKDADLADQEEVLFLVESKESQSRDTGSDILSEALELSNSTSGADIGRTSGKTWDREAGFFDVFERLKQQFYLTSVAKDILQLQLVEQSHNEIEFYQKDQQLFSEVSKLRKCNTSITEELYQCSSELKSMAARKEELQNDCVSAVGKIEELSIWGFELQNKLEFSDEQVSLLSRELADCNRLLGSLQTENANLTGKLELATKELEQSKHEAASLKKIEEEKDILVSENSRLLTELLERNEHLLKVYDKQVQLEDDLKEVMLHAEQLTEDNIYLSSNLDIHREKLNEIDGTYCQLFDQAGEKGNLLESSNSRNFILTGASEREQVLEPQDASSSEPGLNTDGREDDKKSDDDLSIIMKRHLDEAGKIMQRLDKAIQGMDSDQASLRREAGRGASGISKIIQAFELKTHLDGTALEEVTAAEGEKLVHSFEKDDKKSVIHNANDASSVSGWLKIAKEEACDMKTTLKQLVADGEKVNEKFKEEQTSDKAAIMALRELEVEYETQMQQKKHLEVKLLEHLARIDIMHNAIYETQKSADEMGGTILDQVECLQKEVAERVSILEQERNSSLAVIFEAVRKLDQIVQLGSSRSTQSDNILDMGTRLTSVVTAATEAIEVLHEKLQAAYLESAALRASYDELEEKFTAAHRMKESAITLLDKLYFSIGELVNDSCGVEGETILDSKPEEVLELLCANFEMRTEKLQKLLEDRLSLKSAKDDLGLELISKSRDIEELNKAYLDICNNLNTQYGVIGKLIEVVEDSIEPEDTLINSEERPVAHLEALVFLLLRKYREVLGSKVMESNQMQEKMDHLSSLKFQQEDEMLTLRESLCKVEEALNVARSELSIKENELEQSEQRLSSVREKLGIAVAKGKGLVVQRDALKHALTEKSAELEKCWHELQSKNSMLHEIEAKLKSYSEAGERIEALESELSYIRNSATALRESFLQKDSVLQRIEEILEVSELPEHIHSNDIIEKIEWLVRSIFGNSIPLTDWDHQKINQEGPYSNEGLMVTDHWKEDSQPGINPGFEDLTAKYEDLQSRFYSLAEQTEMLEQSLLERNNLVQRWEEVLDRVEMPLSLRSLEPEDKIEWLGRALSEVQHERNSLLLKIENLDISSRSLVAELEVAQKKLYDLEDIIQTLLCEKEQFSANLEKLSREHEKVTEKAAQDEIEKYEYRMEIADLQEKLLKHNDMKKPENNEHSDIENEIRKLQSLVNDALPDHDIEENLLISSNFKCLDGALKKLIDNYAALSVEKSVLAVIVNENGSRGSDAAIKEQRMREELDAKEQDLVILKNDLEEALGALALVKDEQDKTREQFDSLIAEIKAISKQRDDLQEQLNQEEQKSASAREKLSVAVRKGKGLVQQRDHLKQVVEETSTEVKQLKNELLHRDNALQEYEQKVRHFSTYPDKLEILESENIFLRNHLEENKLRFEENELEAKKSKRAAELLLSKVNEVQERVDVLQKELAAAESAVAELSKQKEVAEVAKAEALTWLEKYTSVYTEEKKNQHAKQLELEVSIEHFRQEFHSLSNLLDNFLLNEMQLLGNVEAGLQSFFKQTSSTKAIELPLIHASSGIQSHNLVNEAKFSGISNLPEFQLGPDVDDHKIADELFGLVGLGLQNCARDIALLKERFYKQSAAFDQKGAALFKIMETVKREVAFQGEASDTLKAKITRLELMQKDKDTDISVMRKNITVLYESCNLSISEIENWKAQLLGNGFLSEISSKVRLGSGGQEYLDAKNFTFAEECIQLMADTLLSAVKGLTSIQAEMIEDSQRELRAIILQLRKEVQEKEIEKKRICEELVTQIKEAELIANKYSLDLDSSRKQACNLEKQVKELENERYLLEARVKELKDLDSFSNELQERIGSLTDTLATKEQEIEALMQALDEEESQMEGFANKVEELEKTVLEKNLALDCLEASRSKAVAKLSTTVSKFDELHLLSENLISEVENLQSQLQERDAEISFLRQEVTRCTNDVLASQEISKTNSTEVDELHSWLDMMIARFGMHDMNANDKKSTRTHVHTDFLGKQIASILSELEDLRVLAKNKDAMLQAESTRREELLHKIESLEISLREKESQIELFQVARDSGLGNTNPQEPLEVEQMGQRNKREVTLGPMAPHIRSVRKINNDHVALGIDLEPGNTSLDSEDDKDHGFRSLTTSRVIPRFTRPIADIFDGLWVSGGRMLMRQPTLRLGVVFYWVILHILLATSIV